MLPKGVNQKQAEITLHKPDGTALRLCFVENPAHSYRAFEVFMHRRKWRFFWKFVNCYPFNAREEAIQTMFYAASRILQEKHLEDD